MANTATTSHDTPDEPRRWALDLLALVIGFAATLTLAGYQFGQSNHGVYLLEPLRMAEPSLFANDWFVSHTLQYHTAWSLLVWLLLPLGLPTVFLPAYLGLIAALHGAWFMLVRLLGGGRIEYLLSVMAVSLSAGGIGLGMYTFVQDSAFLPSNIASIAMAVGLALWIAGRPIPAGIALAVAAAFHLNYAVVAGYFAVVLGVWTWLSRASEGRSPHSSSDARVAPDPDASGGVEALPPGSLARDLIGLTIPALVAAVVCGLGWLQVRGRPATTSLADFVEVYVRVRHPHHYDPSSWPIWLWASYLWVIPLAAIAIRIRVGRTPVEAMTWQRHGRAMAAIGVLLAVSLLGAGVFYVSRTLIHLSLMRFSPHLAWLAAIAVGVALGRWWIGRTRASTIAAIATPLILWTGLAVLIAGGNLPVGEGSRSFYGLQLRTAPILFTAVLSAFGAILLLLERMRNPSPIAISLMLAVGVSLAVLGARDSLGAMPVPKDADLDHLAQWISDPANTPEDAVFLTPPDDNAFRLYAKRAIVANFKGVPQLPHELPEWQRRLEDVLGEPLTDLPRPYGLTLAAIGDRYSHLSADHLINVAVKYSARYIVATAALADPRLQEILRTENGRYILYDLGPEAGTVISRD